ncbi:hypothetical protein GX50_02197 [[Emmonsia] crescens]|uniref:Uncharacterized protein n=1 Tax=[Emmonsia] crescens TaxID=73230 RepID=A0A2B7ZP48_9EURO|nr:hypothetical protein GX50_02197 [Emmonsia crescens]
MRSPPVYLQKPTSLRPLILILKTSSSPINRPLTSRAVATAAANLTVTANTATGANPITTINTTTPASTTNIAATAAAMGMKIHPATINTHPHMQNEGWHCNNCHLIDHFKAQHERYTKNSPTNPNDNQDIQYASAAIPIGLNSFQIAY